MCGSYRRGNNFSNDIDLLLFNTKIIKLKEIEQLNKDNIENNLEIFVNFLKKKKIIIDSLTFELRELP